MQEQEQQTNALTAPVTFSEETSLPRFVQMAEILLRRMVFCNLENGAAMPSVRKLAQLTETTIAIVDRAYQRLGDYGFLRLTPCRPTVITNIERARHAVTKRTLTRLDSSIRDAINLGTDPSAITKLVEAATMETQ